METKYKVFMKFCYQGEHSYEVVTGRKNEINRSSLGGNKLQHLDMLMRKENTCPRREWRRWQELCPTRQEGMGPSPPVEVLVTGGSRESFFQGR